MSDKKLDKVNKAIDKFKETLKECLTESEEQKKEPSPGFSGHHSTPPSNLAVQQKVGYLFQQYGAAASSKMDNK